MDDNCLAEDLLLTTRGVCDLYLHGIVESSTVDMHQAPDDALNESFCLRGQIHKKISAKGWYSTKQVEQQKIIKVKNQFADM